MTYDVKDYTELIITDAKEWKLPKFSCLIRLQMSRKAFHHLEDEMLYPLMTTFLALGVYVVGYLHGCVLFLPVCQLLTMKYFPVGFFAGPLCLLC